MIILAMGGAGMPVLRLRPNFKFRAKLPARDSTPRTIINISENSPSPWMLGHRHSNMLKVIISLASSGMNSSILARSAGHGSIFRPLRTKDKREHPLKRSTPFHFHSGISARIGIHFGSSILPWRNPIPFSPLPPSGRSADPAHKYRRTGARRLSSGQESELIRSLLHSPKIKQRHTNGPAEA